MDWIRGIGPTGGARDGWTGDLPLDQGLPGKLTIDITELREPIFPMFCVRLRMFVEWHQSQGHEVVLREPADEGSRRAIQAMLGTDKADSDNLVLAVTNLREFSDVEQVSTDVLNRIEYELTDVSPTGVPIQMAMSELANNAVEHGVNPLGALVAARRMTHADGTYVSLAVADLGIGIPEHIRQVHPEWDDDSFAIAQALEIHVSGTGRSHRGNGFDAVFDDALLGAMQGADFTILSARGHHKVTMYDGKRIAEIFPSPRYRRGTWIVANFRSVRVDQLPS